MPQPYTQCATKKGTANGIETNGKATKIMMRIHNKKDKTQTTATRTDIIGTHVDIQPAL
jgi:hypothetical protein